MINFGGICDSELDGSNLLQMLDGFVIEDYLQCV